MTPIGESDDTLPGLEPSELELECDEELDGGPPDDAELALCAACGMPVNPEELNYGPPPYYCPECAAAVGSV